MVNHLFIHAARIFMHSPAGKKTGEAIGSLVGKAEDHFAQRRRDKAVLSDLKKIETRQKLESLGHSEKDVERILRHM